MKCNTCGAELTQEQKFCSECGAKVSKHCVKCGAELKEGARFCSACGKQNEMDCDDVGVNKQKEITSPQNIEIFGDKEERKKIKIIFIQCFALIMLALLIGARPSPVIYRFLISSIMIYIVYLCGKNILEKQSGILHGLLVMLLCAVSLLLIININFLPLLELYA